MPRLGEQALEQEKISDYRKIVLLQVMIIISALLLKDMLDLAGVSLKWSFIIRDTLFLLLGGIYVLVLWDLLRNFIKKKMVIVAMFFVIMGTYVLAFLTVNPFFKLFATQSEQQPYLFIIHFVLFVIESVVIYFTILDIFSGLKLSSEKLWGTTCVYLMTGISFGSIYDLINIMKPGAMGVPVELGLESYSASIFYSMNMIGGHDAYQDAIPLIHNIGVLESVWCSLFVVVLVGRLLSKPAED